MKSLILAKYTFKDVFRDKMGLLFMVALPVGLVVLGNIGAEEMADRAAMIVMIIYFFMIIIGCVGVGATVLDMRRSGILKRILIMPISKMGFLLGVALDTFARLGVMVGIVFIMMFIYRITIPGSWLDLLIVLLIAVLFALALGLNFAAISKSVFATYGIGIGTSIIVFNLADWHLGGRFEGTMIETIADHNPLYHLFRVILGIIYEGTPLCQFHPELGTVFLWIAVLFLSSVALYRWRIEKMI
ncbi:ABC transporter permease [Dehalococcoidia bacterium]|nr:ABC transporter permease [Dehalococcoidia bacterium]MCL0102579.1 ABC transporter permease [Dehalococcoidia bacterium]